MAKGVKIRKNYVETERPNKKLKEGKEVEEVDEIDRERKNQCFRRKDERALVSI